MPLCLMYHDVVVSNDDESGFPGGGAARYKLTRAEFAIHLEALARATSTPASTLSSLSDPSGSKSRNDWLITFDDGGSSAYDPIATMLEGYNWRGTFLITVDYIGKTGFVDRDQLVSLASRGHVIGSHSCSHPARMAACPRDQLREEWRRSCETLSEILGAKVTTASVPGGYYSRAVAETAAEAGITDLFNSEPTTKVVEVDGCRIHGRYTVYRGMPASAAAALGSGSRSALLKQSATWETKKLLKRIGGGSYVAVRKAILDRYYSRRHGL